MAKQLHWTQTPEGKARMSEVQRKAWETKKARKAQKDERKMQLMETAQQITRAAYKPNGRVAHGGSWRYCPHCGEPLK